jgi:ribosomal protein S18 acetylase RimI-like enzyme
MAEQSFHLVKIADGVRYEIDADRARLDMAVVHGFLATSHWARGIPMAVLQRAIRRSLPFGLYKDGRQIGFARVVTDSATFAYLADVFVLEGERGQGLGRWLVDSILAHPGLQGLRRWLLGTRDAHGLYQKAGFTEPVAPFGFLERLDPAVYEAATTPRRRALRRVV